MKQENIIVKRTGDKNIIVKKLYADDGMILTNGTEYGKVISLAKTDAVGKWKEITEAEYIEIKKVMEDGE